MNAWVAKLVDAQDLKSCETKVSYEFDSRPRHHLYKLNLAKKRIPKLDQRSASFNIRALHCFYRS